MKTKVRAIKRPGRPLLHQKSRQNKRNPRTDSTDKIGHLFAKLISLFCFRSFCIFFLFLAVLSGCAINPVTGKQRLSLISETQEINLGKQARPIIIQEFNGEFKDQELKKYLNEVGFKLAKISHRPLLPYYFGVVNSSEINAFALPGGPVFITRGFLVKLENEAQLAAVFGHEMGHITARHAVEQLQNNLLLQNIISIVGSMTSGTTGEGLLYLGKVTAGLLQLRFSREDERQADLLGLDYAFRAGYNHQGVYEVLQILAREEKDKSPLAFSFLRSHPLMEDRISLVQYQLNQKYPSTFNNPLLLNNREIFQQKTELIKKVQVAYEHYDQAEALMIKGDYKAAISHYRKALLIDRNQALFYSGLGMAFLKMNNYRDAFKNLEEGVKIDPELFKPNLLLGIGLVETSDWIQAVKPLSQAIELVPTQPSPYYFRGLAYEGLHSRMLAIQDYRTVVTLAPSSEVAEKARARLIRLGRFS